MGFFHDNSVGDITATVTTDLNFLETYSMHLSLIHILNPKRVFTYEMLMELVWEEDYTYYSRKAVNNHVSNLRRKLKIAPDLPDYVKSVYGIGYKFEAK